MPAYDRAKHYILQNTADAAGSMNFPFNAEALADAQALAQSVATLLGIKLNLHSVGRAAANTSPWNYSYSPDAQGTTVLSPSGVFPL